jgi:hypothetical protein
LKKLKKKSNREGLLMDKRYLLTYDKEITYFGQVMWNVKTYEWFEDEEEMNDFIEEWDITPIEKFYIADANAL